MDWKSFKPNQSGGEEVFNSHREEYLDKIQNDPEFQKEVMDSIDTITDPEVRAKMRHVFEETMAGKIPGKEETYAVLNKIFQDSQVTGTTFLELVFPVWKAWAMRVGMKCQNDGEFSAAFSGFLLGTSLAPLKPEWVEELNKKIYVDEPQQLEFMKHAAEVLVHLLPFLSDPNQPERPNWRDIIS